MPSVITHYVLAKRALSCVNVANEEAFLLGAQGPDMFFFFRAYPWMPGRAGLPLGNAIHETKPSVLIESMRRAAAEVGDEDDILESYISGFLCHYAADRTIHPFVHDRQTALRDVLPCHAQTDDPYHYYCESAFDVYVLRVDEGRDVSSFKLTAVLPPRDSRRDELLARFYATVLPMIETETRTETQLRRLTRDMRQSMWWMTDRFGWKRSLIRATELVLRKDARFSSLVRTKRLPNFDFINEAHRPFVTEEYGECRDDLLTLCDKTVSLAASLIASYARGTAMDLQWDFAGHRIK